MFGGGEACLDVVIVEDDFIIAGRGFFGGMAVTGTVAAVRSGLRAGVQLDIAGGRHHEHIAKVGMAGAAEMRVAETHNGAVFVLVAGTVFIDSGLVTLVHVMGNCVGVGAELHDAERCTRSGKVCPMPLVPMMGLTYWMRVSVARTLCSWRFFAGWQEINPMKTNKIISRFMIKVL